MLFRRHIRSIKTEYSQWIHQLLHNNSAYVCAYNESLPRQKLNRFYLNLNALNK